MRISHLLWVLVAVSFGSGKAWGQTADALRAMYFAATSREWRKCTRR